MRTAEELLALPSGTVVHAVHPQYGMEGVAALRTTLANGEPVWMTTGDENAYTSEELVGCMGGAEFHVLTHVAAEREERT